MSYRFWHFLSVITTTLDTNSKGTTLTDKNTPWRWHQTSAETRINCVHISVRVSLAWWTGFCIMHGTYNIKILQ